MGLSLLWIEDLASLAEGASPRPQQARFPARGAAPASSSTAVRPHLTPTRVAAPGSPEFAAARRLVAQSTTRTPEPWRPPAQRPAPAQQPASGPAPVAAAAPPAQQLPTRVARPQPPAVAPAPPAPPQPPSLGPTPVVASVTRRPAVQPAAASAPPARAAVTRTAVAQPPSLDAAAPATPSLESLARVPAQAAHAAVASAGRAGPVSVSSAAWQRPTFKSVELRIDALDLEMAAMASQLPASAKASAKEPEPALAPVRPADPFHAELDSFLELASASVAAAAAFVADAEGLELANRQANVELLAVSGLMGGWVDELRRTLHAESEGALGFELDERHLLQVLWVDTVLGRLALGLVVAAAPDAAALATLRERLKSIARASAVRAGLVEGI